MNCLICRQAEIIDDCTILTFERGEFRFQINNVPAEICPSCGEAIVDEETATRLLRLAENAIHEGIFERVFDFSK